MLFGFPSKLKASWFRKGFLFVFMPIAFWLISMYPAILTPDSYLILRNLKNPSEPFDAGIGGTPLYSLIVDVVSFNGKFLVFVASLQAILMYVALYMWVSALMPSKYTTYRLTISGVLFTTPFFGPIAVSIWKDSLSLSLTMIGIALLSKSFVSIMNKSLAIALLSLGSAMRYEGYVVLLVWALILLLLMPLLRNVLKKRLLKNVFVCSLLSIFISLGISSGSKFFMKWESPAKWFSTQSFLLDLEYVYSNYPERLDVKIQDVLDDINPTRPLVGKESCSDVTPFYTSNYNRNAANEYSIKMPMLWFQAFNSNAREALVHARICRTTAFLPWPFFEAPVQGFWPTIGHGPNELKPERPELIYKFTYPVGWIWTRLWTTNGSFLAWPGGHFTLVIILALFLRGRSQTKYSNTLNLTLLIPGTFLIARIAVLFLNVSGGEYRYLPHVYFLSLPLIVIVLLNLLNVVGKKN